MATLLFVNDYNNYFNKTVKMDTLSSVQSSYTCVTKTNRDFNPGDYVTTELIENWNESWEPNYVFVLNDAGTEITSSWFIKSFDRTRRRQYHAELKRDSIRDHYENVINAPMVVNRAMLDENNPLLFNSEGFDFNQIKTREILLQDEYRSRWIYLYMAKNAADKSNVAVAYNPYAHSSDRAVNDISDSIFDGEEHNSYSLRRDTAVEIYAKYRFKQGWRTDNYQTNNGQFKKRLNGNYSAYGSSSSWNLIISAGTLQSASDSYIYGIERFMKDKVIINNALNNALITDYHAYVGPNNYMSAEEEEFLNNATGKTIYEQSTGKYYIVKSVTKKNYSHEIRNSTSYRFCSVLTDQLSSYFYDGTTPDEDTYNAELEYTTYKVKLEELETLNFTVSVTPSTKATTDDSECNIIAIPLEGFRVQTGPEDPDTGVYPYVDIDGSEDVNLAIARSIAREYGSSVVYDMQILPYGPFPNSWSHSGELDVSSMDSKLYNYVSYQPASGRMYAGYIFYLPTSNLTFDIGQTVEINNYTDNAAINKKISNECDMYRLCSPNYNGMFEFSVAKNDGVSKFNVDMTLRPYNPYIHINPDFKGLYGQDFNDSRGLILGGDFSLPITGDAFVNYELQNKNYQLAFDRQIAHMDRENKIARRETIASTIAGALQGGATGAAGGSIIGSMIGTAGGPIGAGVGLAAGLGTSAIGGALDYSNLKKRQVENKDYAIDMFEYNLGNIKALPYSLSKVNPLTYNNKKFPFVEVYEATEAEKNILLNKITYQSMNVNAIGTIADYKQNEPTFISGNIIRIEGGLDNHISEDIYNEIAKGVYI